MTLPDLDENTVITALCQDCPWRATGIGAEDVREALRRAHDHATLVSHYVTRDLDSRDPDDWPGVEGSAT